MKQSINLYQFREAFERADRTNNFSYDGLRVLFEFIEQYEEDTGEETEFDVVAICCEFSEDDPSNIADNYRIDISECENDDDIRETVTEYLNDNTMICGTTDAGNIIYQQF